MLGPGHLFNMLGGVKLVYVVTITKTRPKKGVIIEERKKMNNERQKLL